MVARIKSKLVVWFFSSVKGGGLREGCQYSVPDTHSTGKQFIDKAVPNVAHNESYQCGIQPHCTWLLCFLLINLLHFSSYTEDTRDVGALDSKVKISPVKL